MASSFHQLASSDLLYQSQLIAYHGRDCIGYLFVSTVPRCQAVVTESIFARLALHLQINVVHFQHEDTTLRLQPISPRPKPVAPT